MDLRNTRYQADATPYLGRTCTGWIAPACLAHSFDHLVGDGEQRRRNREAERLRGLEVDHQLEFRGLHHRKVSRLLALENPPDINANLSIGIDETGAVAHQAARCGKVAPNVQRGNRMARRERDDPITPVIKEWSGSNE